MQISINPAGLQGWTGAMLIVGLFEQNLEKQLIDLDPLFEGSLTKCLQQQNFTAKAGKVVSFQLLNGNPDQLVLVGLGNQQEFNLNGLRKAAALGARAVAGRSGVVGIHLPWGLFNTEEAAIAVGEATRLSLFKDLRFKNNPEKLENLDRLDLIGLENLNEASLQKIDPICQGVELARQLVGAPPNELTPKALAEIALLIAKENDLKAKVLEREDCQEIGMGAYLAVSQGSDLDPKFIHLTYVPQGEVKRRLAIVGKGLTFDSGGYNLKVGAAQIDMMKFDMGGSAAVLGAAKAISEIRPNDIEVHFIVAACENMVNGSAVHPGDIVKASNGTTIEINNTDAEGRLTLADALVYSCGLKPDAIVDLATLTGACVIALGDEIAGLWSNSDQLANDLKKAADAAGEGLWRMPMRNSYKDGLKSMLADIKNTGPRQGGSITAALFLKEFVDASIQWAHIDIAGTVWSEKERGIDPAGATGYGVRTLVNWIINQ